MFKTIVEAIKYQNKDAKHFAVLTVLWLSLILAITNNWNILFYKYRGENKKKIFPVHLICLISVIVSKRNLKTV